MSAAAIAISGLSHSAEARDQSHSITVDAAPLADALAELSRQSGISIGTEGSLPQQSSRAVRKARSIREALDRMLEGSGWRARKVGPSAWRIERASSAPTSLNAARDDGPAAKPVEIIVTGTKRAQPLDDLPMAAMVVMLGDEVGASSTHGTDTIASRIDGLTLTSSGSGRNRMFLRGVADSAFNGESQATVAVVLDEARLTLSAPDPDIRLVDMDRVEVLKGPQGASHGIGTLGGVYRMVTRRAEMGENALTATAGLSASSHGDAGYSGSLAGNLALGDGAAVRLVGYRSDEPGWIDSGDRSDRNHTRVNGARIGIGLEPGDGWRLDGTGFFQTIHAADSDYVYARKTRKRPAQLAEPHNNDLHHIAARLTREGEGGMDIVLTSAMTWHSLDSRFDATRGAGHYGLDDPLRLDERRSFRIWDSEARLSGNAGRIGWMIGANHIETRQKDRTELTSASEMIRLDGEDRRIAELALFGNLSLPLTRRLELDLGARLFRDTFEEGEATMTRHRHRYGLTPSVALRWKPGGTHVLYARYASAIRTGDFDISRPGSKGRLRDDEVHTLELGWRAGRPGNRIEIGAWQSWWRHMQSDMPDEPGLFEPQNVGNARITGLEASLEQTLAEGLSLSAGVNWTHARLVSNATDGEISGNDLPSVPEISARLAFEKAFWIGSLDGKLRFKLRHIGATHLSFDSRYDARTDPIWETGLELQLRLGQTDLLVEVDNLLDRQDNRFAYGNQLRFSSGKLCTPQPPRQLSVSLRHSF